MGPFAALERFFERLFERPSARLFHTRLQPIQLQRRLERAMENGRFSASDRVVVPNRYLVRLASADLEAFGDFADSLEIELADAGLRYARAHHYTLSDRPAVRLVADTSVPAGDARIDASFSDAAAPAEDAAAAEGEVSFRPAPPSIPGSPKPDMTRGGPAAGDPNCAGLGTRAAPPEANAASAADPAVGARMPAAEPPGIRSAGRPRGEPSPAAPAGPSVKAPWPASPARPSPPARPAAPAGYHPVEATRTMIFEVPTVDAPHAVLREISPDGTQRRLTLDGGPVTIGRATDNNLVLRDSRTSRYHGRLTTRQGALVYSDLGSTNGSRVNGIEIDEVVLGSGDRIELGDTVLVVESVAGG